MFEVLVDPIWERNTAVLDTVPALRESTTEKQKSWIYVITSQNKTTRKQVK